MERVLRLFHSLDDNTEIGILEKVDSLKVVKGHYEKISDPSRRRILTKGLRWTSVEEAMEYIPPISIVPYVESRLIVAMANLYGSKEWGSFLISRLFYDLGRIRPKRPRSLTASILHGRRRQTP